MSVARCSAEWKQYKDKDKKMAVQILGESKV